MVNILSEAGEVEEALMSSHLAEAGEDFCF